MPLASCRSSRTSKARISKARISKVKAKIIEALPPDRADSTLAPSLIERLRFDAAFIERRMREHQAKQERAAEFAAQTIYRGVRAEVIAELNSPAILGAMERRVERSEVDLAG
jgi:hypothetical protein